ncbi:FAD-dependent oxidoreductase [Reichenbachiella sp. MALMAid0571]|uniref:NAD(P)/FAD-dependent oxidoreductase n=1 Tax=Reichenbachiella sp. MALMAid0571 TaxID=3143939 RepID=UPI0032DF473B
MSHIIIIGNGISGITTARHVRKLSDDQITVISGETDYFFSRTALMYIYMGHMKYEHTKPYEDWFWEKNKIALKKAWVTNIDINAQELSFADGEKMTYDKLVLSLGSKPNKFGWPGEDLIGVSGLYSYQDLEYIEKHSKDIDKAVIVGGGLIGVELAEMFHSRKIDVSFLVREKSFWDVMLPKEESAMINKEILDHHIDLRLETELKEIVSDENGRVKAIVTGNGETIPCQFVGLTAGVSPNIALVENSGIESKRGILVDEYLQTNIPNVFAVGDCAEFRNPLPGRRSIEQVWYTGRMQGETLARTLTGKQTAYRPGIWFNSAKFFNIEYQTYGTVLVNLKENENRLYWEHASGKICLKVVFDSSTQEVIGINTFGIRMRHKVWDKWLREKRDLHYVMKNLEEANFDPEFFKRYENQIREVYNNMFPDNKIEPVKKGFLQSIFN